MTAGDGLIEREVYYDWEAELPSGMWPVGYRTLKMRTWVLAHGIENAKSEFVVRHVIRTVRHEVDPADWRQPPTPRGVETA